MSILKTCPCCKSLYPLPDNELEDTVCDECGTSQSIDPEFQKRQIEIWSELAPRLLITESAAY